MGLSISLIWSKLFNSGERPPCMQNILLSMSAAIGKQLKHLMTTNFVEHYIISGITEQVTKLNSFAPFTLNMNIGFL